MSLPPQDPAAPRYPRALVVMVKEPRPGACKTRLCPPLTGDEAAGLYRAFLEDIGRELEEWSFEGDLWVAWSDDESGDEREAGAPPEGLGQCFGPSFRFLQQRGDSLTERMQEVFDRLFHNGYQQVVMRNSDSPHLETSLLSSAFDGLTQRRGTLVLGPDLDGGFYLVGLDVPPSGLFPPAMSTGSVLDETVRSARERGLEVELLPSFLDIDTADDLLTFWLEFGGRADVRHWATWNFLHNHPMLDRLGA